VRIRDSPEHGSQGPHTNQGNSVNSLSQPHISKSRVYGRLVLGGIPIPVLKVVPLNPVERNLVGNSSVHDPGIVHALGPPIDLLRILAR
jgi:hypothetical protein